ncbi:YopX family protein [Bacillus subtilis]|uniref:YopX family protein n=1 Tax=Bacillus subtilis TaxID=1423 RepID=UPI002165BBDE|nr:YopX family protein [Bacillus subtilis]MEC0451481.1 YopX family protein [Bacillus subtilis]MEC0453280.1 YopX family protein [Bacillus subtilis]MEC0498666.1 YopX family protein [Bacillus subtilis]UVW12350.1 YopX family protein [Bacillus subtilis]
MERQLIKFRAWDHENNKMLSWEDIKNNFCDYLDNNLFSVMQFIGLTDKKGTEIYEGDILKSDFISQETLNVGYNFTRFVLVRKDGQVLHQYIDERTSLTIEIVGHVYQE